MKRKVYLIASMVFLLSLFFAMSVSAGAEGNGSNTLIIKINRSKAPTATEFGRVEGYDIYITDTDESNEYKIIFRHPATGEEDIGSAFGTMFQGKDFVTEVHLTDNCTKIPANAFSGCTALTTVTTGSDCDEIGSGAFSGCTKLSKVGDIEIKAGMLSIPSTWTSIGEGAFSGINSFDVIRWAGGASTTAHIGDANHYRLTVASDSHGAKVLGDVDHDYTADNAVFVRAGTSLTSFSADDGYYVTANNTELSDSNDKMPAEDTTISAASAVKTHTDYVKFSNVTIKEYGDCHPAFYFSDGKSLVMSETIRGWFSAVSEESSVMFCINVNDIPADVSVQSAKLVK